MTEIAQPTWAGLRTIAQNSGFKLAYCLMTNHAHLVIVPEFASALEKVFRPLHTRYAQRINRSRGWSGHLWQGRFYSPALDERYLWTAIRYVERNPVRAGMVRRAEDYCWSSAPAHCKLINDYVLTTDAAWVHRLITVVDDWSQWLSDSDGLQEVTVLREHVERGLPCGTDGFVRELEDRAGQLLRAMPRGRPKNAQAQLEKGVRPL